MNFPDFKKFTLLKQSQVITTSNTLFKPEKAMSKSKLSTIDDLLKRYKNPKNKIICLFESEVRELLKEAITITRDITLQQAAEKAMLHHHGGGNYIVDKESILDLKDSSELNIE